MLNNLKSLKSIIAFLKRENNSIVYFGNDIDISWVTKRCQEDVGDVNLAKVLKDMILEYKNLYGIEEKEILMFHRDFQLKGWKKEVGDCTAYLLEINPQLRIYFFCGSNKVCKDVKFLYKRE